MTMVRRSKGQWLLIGTGMLVLTLLHGQSTTFASNESDKDKLIEQLRQEIASLKQELTKLSGRVQKLEQKPAPTATAPMVVTPRVLTTPYPAPQAPRPRWVPGQHEGIPFYTIPLQKE